MNLRESIKAANEVHAEMVEQHNMAMRELAAHVIAAGGDERKGWLSFIAAREALAGSPGGEEE